jgi:hypothetical protein
MNAPETQLASATYDSAAEGYNFAYLDEQTKRMIRSRYRVIRCRLPRAKCRCRSAGAQAVSR